MTAVVAAAPTSPTVGTPVVISGSGFTDGATVTAEIVQAGVKSQVVADASGAWGTTDIADHATTTLTDTTNVNPTANDTVVIGANTYVWKAAPTTVANEVKIGTDVNTSLQNLKDAINRTGTAGTQYGSGTVIHPTVAAGDINTSTHALKLHAKTGGTAGNSLTSTVTGTVTAFPGATFNSGTPGSAATGVSSMIWVPGEEGTYTITATDGTNEATTTCRVWE